MGWEAFLERSQTGPGPSPSTEAIPELMCSRVLLPWCQGQDQQVSPGWGAGASPRDAALSLDVAANGSGSAVP